MNKETTFGGFRTFSRFVEVKTNTRFTCSNVGLCLWNVRERCVQPTMALKWAHVNTVCSANSECALSHAAHTAGPYFMYSGHTRIKVKFSAPSRREFDV